MLRLTVEPLCLWAAAPNVSLAMAQLLKAITVVLAASVLTAIIALRLQLRKALP